MPTKPPFAYYGGKNGVAPKIIATFPPHRTYVEPFAGSLAMLFAKEPSRIEIVNDLDSAIVTFFRVARDRHEELVRALELTPYARDEFCAAEDDPELDDLERARRLWIRVTQSFQKVAAPPRRCQWSFSAVRPKATETLTFSHRIYEIARRLRTVEIENIDAVELIAKIEEPDALLYVDPPYMGATRTAGTRYAHDLLDEDSHRSLAEVLRSRKCFVALSGYAHPLYEELYEAHGWNRLEFEVLAIAGNAKDGQPSRTEIVWTNYEPHAGSLFG